MRDLVLTLVLFALLPACYRKPFVGLAVFSWLAYMRVQDLTWGFARNMRWSYYVAIITFAGFLVSKERLRWFQREWRCYVMMLLALLIGIGILVSREPNLRQFERYLEYDKIIAVGLFTTAIVTTRERLRVLCWIIALSFGFFGVKAGIWGIMTLGRTAIIRGPGGMLADNNDFSLALSMAVPMLFHLGWTERKPEIRKVFWFSLPLTIITIGLTRSRGGFLALSSAIAVLVWRSKNRVQGLVVAGLVAVVALLAAPQAYKERLLTILEPSKEGSASSRLRAWGIATRMAMDNPVFGVGMNKFQQHYQQYNPDYQRGEEIIVAHSSYFQIWAECGTPALLLYFTLIGGSFWTCWRVRAEARRRYHTSWIINYANMFEASLAAFMVGSAFLNRAHFDLFYHFVCVIIAFATIARREMAEELANPLRSQGGRGEIVAVERAGFGRRTRASAYSAAVPRGA
ncbi:MAG: putative O-glycosylation ligase, exosortase A system-associated [Planctomycetes bacterium]|nr:putative O-glycosylation ligase, exosortase A system-associated [Planctomycetota bacterium]